MNDLGIHNEQVIEWLAESRGFVMAIQFPAQNALPFVLRLSEWNDARSAAIGELGHVDVASEGSASLSTMGAILGAITSA
jgi:hypothetical protein